MRGVVELGGLVSALGGLGGSEGLFERVLVSKEVALGVGVLFGDESAMALSRRQA